MASLLLSLSRDEDDGEDDAEMRLLETRWKGVKNSRPPNATNKRMCSPYIAWSPFFPRHL